MTSGSDWTPERIRALRIRLAMSQADFAYELRRVFPPLRTDTVAVSRWENGHVAPSGPAIYALAQLDRQTPERALEAI